MLKYFEFKSNGIKKRKRLKKMKKNDLTEDDRRRQEIIDNHSVFVAGASGFAEGFNNISEKKHLKMEIKLTPEWILDKMSLSRGADGHGVIRFYAEEENCHWLELALETLGIKIIKDGDEFIKPYLINLKTSNYNVIISDTTDSLTTQEL